MAIDLNAVTHVTKIDPAKPFPAGAIDPLGETDLVLVGGSDDVTAENTLAAVRRIREQFPELSIYQEPYNASHVSMELAGSVDGITVPAVYNGDRSHFLGKHLELFTQLGAKPDEIRGSDLPLFGERITSKGEAKIHEITESIIPEGYVIQNLDSTAAAVTGAKASFTSEQVAGAALATESFYRFPVFYIEYSGRYGGPAEVEQARRFLDETILFYGGGIDSGEKATEVLEAGADAIVVGNCFHEDPKAYAKTLQ